jgi:glutamine synthetase
MVKTVCEYIWIGGDGELRSKTRILQVDNSSLCNSTTDISIYPDWNYDASSTGQLSSYDNTEGILKPVAVFKNPLLKLDFAYSVLVLCDTYDVTGTPLATNHRYNAKQIFDKKLEEEPWFGLEQEYFILCNTDFDDNYTEKFINVFEHYCGYTSIPEERQIVKEHLKACLEAGINISGMNAEVATYQWEFQIGPSVGISAADELIVARYLLEKIAEKYRLKIQYHPKPVLHANGSGCHTNFSTRGTRSVNGIEDIYKYLNRMKQKHYEHILICGKHNENRLTGHHETASYTNFTWGIGTRNTSVRIPSQVIKDGCGYFEDRRPAANMDPYQVTSFLFETCCLEPEYADI